MSRPAQHIREEEDLLGRIYGSADLTEALSILFDSLPSSQRIDRALVLREEERELRAIVGMGWTEDEVAGIAIALEDSLDPIAECYRARSASIVVSSSPWLRRISSG